MLKRNQGLLATLIASLILAVVVTGCGGGGGTKPPPVDRQIDVACFFQMIGNQKVTVSDLHVVWTINGQTTISQTRSDGILAITVRQQGAFRVSLSSADSPPAFDPLVIDVPVQGMATPREVQLLTEITVTRSVEGELSTIWSSDLRSIKLQIVEIKTASRSREVITPDLAREPVCTAADIDPIKDGEVGLKFSSLSDQDLIFFVRRPGITDISIALNDQLEPITCQVTVRDANDPFNTIIEPAEAKTVEGTINLSATFRDDYLVAWTEIIVRDSEGKIIKSIRQDGATASYLWNTTEVKDGNYTFQAFAKDLWSNDGSSEEILLTVKNPWVLPAPTANLTLSREPDIDVKSIPGLENVEFYPSETYAIGPDGTQWLGAGESLVVLDANDQLVGVYDAPIHGGDPIQIELGPADVDEQGRLVMVGFWDVYRVSLPGPVFEVFTPPPGESNLSDIFVDCSVTPSRTFISNGSGVIEVKLQNGRAIEVNRWELGAGHFIVDSVQDVLFAVSPLTATRLSGEMGEMKEYDFLDHLGMAKATNNYILITSPYILGEPTAWWLVGYDGVIRSSLNGYVGGEIACHPDINGKIRTVYNNYKVDGLHKPKIAVIDLVSQ